MKIGNENLILRPQTFVPVPKRVIESSVYYIYNWSFQHFSQYYNLAFHSIYVVWVVNFRHNWRDLQLKLLRLRISDFRETFYDNLRFYDRNLLRGSC